MSHTRAPGSRGYRHGQDAWANQTEAQAGRKQQLPRQDGWAITTAGANVYFSSTSAQTYTANMLVLVPVGHVERVYHLDRAAVSVRVMGAGTPIIGVGLYTWHRESALLRCLPGARVFGYPAGAGELEIDFPQPVFIYPEAHYVIGFCSATATCQLSSISAAGGVPLRHRQIAITGPTALPASIRIVDTAYSTEAIPQVAMYSLEASLLM